MKIRNKPYDINSRSFFESIYENLYPYDSNKRRVILKNNTVIYKSEDTEKYNFFDYYKDYCEDSYFADLKTPHIICTGQATFYNLESVSYDQSTIDYLNKEGLYIYLQEAMLLHFGEKKNLVLKKEDAVNGEIFLEELSSYYNIPEDKTQIYGFELESIKKFILKNNLKNVTVFTNELNTRNLLEEIYPEFKIASFNNWTLTYHNDFLDEITEKQISIDRVETKMLSLSLRYEPHKHLISSYVIGRNAELSWFENGRAWDNLKSPSLEYLDTQVPFNFLDWKVKYPEIYQRLVEGNALLAKHGPIILNGEEDYLDPSENRIPCGTGLPIPVKYHARAFCYLDNETKFGQPFGYFSEKAINSMACLRPFIMIAPPYSLKYLKLLGFKTFDQWWDESYDQEENHELRMIKILKLIDYIDQFSIDELKNILLEMKDVLTHNKKHITEVRKNYSVF